MDQVNPTDVKTIDVRVLVGRDVDPNLFVQQLITQTTGAGAPIGATELQHFDDGVRVSPYTHFRRSDVEWEGQRVS